MKEKFLWSQDTLQLAQLLRKQSHVFWNTQRHIRGMSFFFMRPNHSSTDLLMSLNVGWWWINVGLYEHQAGLEPKTYLEVITDEKKFDVFDTEWEQTTFKSSITTAQKVTNQQYRTATHTTACVQNTSTLFAWFNGGAERFGLYWAISQPPSNFCCYCFSEGLYNYQRPCITHHNRLGQFSQRLLWGFPMSLWSVQSTVRDQ